MIPKPKHDHHELKFPEGFLWGAATSAHQVEGNNKNSDWWEWEQTRAPHLRSGEACNQYELFEKDFQMLKDLGHNSHRLSIEWSRIEKCEGQFDLEEIEHYKKVLKSLKDKNITVMLTLHHFTNPAWLAKKGGWESLRSPYYFERFVKRIVPELKEYVDLWITINEPALYVFMSYLGGDPATGNWPPQKNNPLLSLKVMWNLARAHKKAYRAIHNLVRGAQVGVANNLSSFQSYHKHSPLELLAVFSNDILSNHIFDLFIKGDKDIIGINYYFNRRLNTPDGKFAPEIVDVTRGAGNVSDLGWEVYPEGIFDVLTDSADHLPIYITECGIASTNDDRRNRFLINYLQEVYRAISAGINIKGFFYWSLIDNFEWHMGFTPRFGLVEIDYQTQKRTPRPSALVYKDIIMHNGIPHKLMKFLGHTVQAMEVLETEEKDLRLTPKDMTILKKAVREEERADHL